MSRGRKRKQTESPPLPKKRKQWSNKSMVLAMEAVQAGRFGVNEAARMYDLPSTTLKDWMRYKRKSARSVEFFFSFWRIFS